MLRESMTINQDDRLEIGGVDCVTLAEEFGTPLYVMNEDVIRKVCRTFLDTLRSKYSDSEVCFASKVFCTQALYPILESEGMGTDVVSAGELYTALSAGFPAEKIYFHGNNKLPYEVEFALKQDVHAIVVDGWSDLEMIERACRRTGKTAKVLVRLNLGIEAHTHKYIQTSRADSKFGVSIEDGTATELIQALCRSQTIEFLGLHSHIGSQIFELTPYSLAVDKMTDYMAQLAKLGIGVKELNLGGGFGIKYTESDRPYALAEYAEHIAVRLQECLADKNLPAPRLIIEPGRSIVGEAGTTLYTVGAIKEIKGLKKYVCVDGGMFENPRFALYQAKYDAVVASRMTAESTEKVTIAGKCCESGDILVEDILLPKVERGDILAVFDTGAYNYSMASHYNRNFVPAVVLIHDKKAECIVRQETFEDLIARDVIPDRLKGNKK